MLAQRSAVSRAARWKALEADRAPYVRRLARQLARAFAAQETEVAAALAASAVPRALAG